MTTRMPNFFTTKKMRTLLKVVPKMHSKVPSTAPKAYPAPISRGSPGTMAIITWKATMPKKASRPQKPWLSTQARQLLRLGDKLQHGLAHKPAHCQGKCHKQSQAHQRHSPLFPLFPFFHKGSPSRPFSCTF